MKKILNILILLNCVSFGFAQSAPRKSTEKSPKVSAEVHLKAQIKALNVCVDSLSIAHQKEINDLEIRMDSLNVAYHMEIKELHQINKENCTIYYDRLDAEFDRTLVVLSLIWGLLGVLVGLVIPIIINRTFERHLTKQIEQLKEDTQQQLSNVIEKIETNSKKFFKAAGKDISQNGAAITILSAFATFLAQVNTSSGISLLFLFLIKSFLTISRFISSSINVSTSYLFLSSLIIGVAILLVLDISSLKQASIYNNFPITNTSNI